MKKKCNGNWKNRKKTKVRHFCWWSSLFLTVYCLVGRLQLNNKCSKITPTTASVKRTEMKVAVSTTIAIQIPKHQGPPLHTRKRYTAPNWLKCCRLLDSDVAHQIFLQYPCCTEAERGWESTPLRDNDGPKFRQSCFGMFSDSLKGYCSSCILSLNLPLLEA